MKDGYDPLTTEQGDLFVEDMARLQNLMDGVPRFGDYPKAVAKLLEIAGEANRLAGNLEYDLSFAE